MSPVGRHTTHGVSNKIVLFCLDNELIERFFFFGKFEMLKLQKLVNMQSYGSNLASGGLFNRHEYLHKFNFLRCNTPYFPYEKYCGV